MEKLNCRELLAEQSGWSAVLAATACCTGAVFCFVKWKHSKKIHTKIQKAVARREQSKLDVENAVLQFRKQHPEAKSAPVLSLSLTELSKQLKEGSLTPATVLHTYMEKGHDSTCGVSIKLDCPEKEDSVVVQVLKRQGAIPFVKTNIPQGLLNLLLGQCFPLAFWCNSASGYVAVTMAPGPMGRDVDSLALFMKAVLSEDMFLLDPCVPPIPFNDEVYSSSKTLRIGYYDTDGYLVPSPSMRRAVLETKALLEKAGHTVSSACSS
ncbi:UNVERIFIED_CONTAM: hypothetical protein FKN15_074721 [Acipenser sinensis]